MRSSWGILVARASEHDLNSLLAVLLVLAVIAGAGITLWLLSRGAWVAALAGAVITILFAVFLL